MAARARLIWQPHPNVIIAGLTGMEARLGRNISRIFDRGAAIAERRAKTGAPWQDRTGNARAGLRGQSEVRAGRAELVLSGNQHYSQWLELAHQGRWATIIPTMQGMGEFMRSELRGAMSR